MIVKSHDKLPPTLPGFEHVRRFWSPSHNCPAAKILPGEYYVTTSNEAVLTVLGSCISVCIRDPFARVGGMNHFMLPVGSAEDGERWSDSTVNMATRYGNFAMEHLINDILKHGGRRDRLELKVAGGARVIQGMTDVGSRNIGFVQHYLKVEGFNVLSKSVGGNNPRRVIYFPLTGEAWIMKLGVVHSHAVEESETSYMKSLEHKPSTGDVELFD